MALAFAVREVITRLIVSRCKIMKHKDYIEVGVFELFESESESKSRCRDKAVGEFWRILEKNCPKSSTFDSVYLRGIAFRRLGNPTLYSVFSPYDFVSSK